MRRLLTFALLAALLLRADPASAHAGREFVIAYPAGDAPARTIAHLLGMVALDRLGFDVRILSLPAGEIAPRIVKGTVSLAIVPAVTVSTRTGWIPGERSVGRGEVLWGRYVHAAGELHLLVPSREQEDLRFDAVAAVLGRALAGIDLAFFTSLGTIPVAEGKFTGPLRRALEGRGIL
jgi:hypothetical protein